MGLRILEGVGLNGESMHDKLNHGWLLGIPLTKTVHTHTRTHAYAGLKRPHTGAPRMKLMYFLFKVTDKK